MANELIHLFDNYYFREATSQEFEPFFAENRPKIFSDAISIMVENWMTNDEKAKQNLLRALIKDKFIYRVFILHYDTIIGWHTGRQIDVDVYHMSNTALFKEYQNKGIYTSLLPKLLEIYQDKGFQKVESRHHPSNNAVLIPKLKAGFVITGMEVDERFGTLIRLTYIFDERRLRTYKYRTGELRPDEDLKKYIG